MWVFQYLYLIQGKKTTEDQEKTNAPVNDNKSGKQKKKKKTGKPQTMSLEEFKQMPAEVVQNSDDGACTWILHILNLFKCDNNVKMW